MSTPSWQNAMEHVVVVMFENRSFDNLLGRLYEPDEVVSFEGVIGKDLSNPIPSYTPGAERGVEVRAMNREPPHPDAMLALAGLLYHGLLVLRGQPRPATAQDKAWAAHAPSRYLDATHRIGTSHSRAGWSRRLQGPGSPSSLSGPRSCRSGS